LKVLVSTVLALMAVGYIGLCGILYANQDLLLYPGAVDSNPPGYDSFRVQSGIASLKVWQLHADAEPALLYFGGNGEDLGANLPDFDKAFPDRAVYFMNYRGYGGSTGSPSEDALIADAQATYDHIRTRHGRIAVMGRSLGSGVAVAVAATRKVEKVVLVTPYDSISNVAAAHYPWAPVQWLIRDDYDSVKRMSSVRAPVLVLIAEHDEVIPRSHSDALLAAIPQKQLRLKVMPNCTHNDFGDYPAYLKTVRSFLAKPSAH
jgi:pimeloyl-ACP methyl ester carboxylesterase